MIYKLSRTRYYEPQYEKNVQHGIDSKDGSKILEEEEETIHPSRRSSPWKTRKVARYKYSPSNFEWIVYMFAKANGHRTVE